MKGVSLGYIMTGVNPSAHTPDPTISFMRTIFFQSLFVFGRCKIEPVMAEIDRIVRPGGKLIVRDESSTIGEVENLLKSLHWEVHLTFSKNQEGILSAQKSEWRPDSYAARS